VNVRLRNISIIRSSPLEVAGQKLLIASLTIQTVNGVQEKTAPGFIVFFWHVLFEVIRQPSYHRFVPLDQNPAALFD